MHLTSTVFTLVAVSTATDLRGYFEGNCGGGYVECVDIATGTCCVIPNPDPTLGAPSIEVLYADPGTQLFGYKWTRNGDYCGAIAAQVATGSLSSVCMTLPSAGDFAAARWYPAFPRMSSSCAPTSSESCSGSATPDTMVLKDGHAFDLAIVDEATRSEMYSYLINGSTIADLPQHVLALEKKIVGLKE